MLNNKRKEFELRITNVEVVSMAPRRKYGREGQSKYFQLVSMANAQPNKAVAIHTSHVLTNSQVTSIRLSLRRFKVFVAMRDGVMYVSLNRHLLPG